MRAELLKLRFLPTPRWSAIFVLVALVLGVAGTWRWGIGTDQLAVDLSLGLPLAIVSIVIGAWVVGLEYGQKTMPRLLAADPRRSLVVIRKLTLVVLATIFLTVVIYAVGYPAFTLAAEANGAGLDRSLYLDQALVSLINNVAYALIAAGFALLTASMAGGLTAAFVFIFVFSGFFSVLPEVGDWSFSIALTEVTDPILGASEGLGLEEPDADPRPLMASLGIVLGWIALITGAGWIRFVRGEAR